MAGDRRATMGNIIAQRDIEKVFPTDEYSCVGIAGTAGLAVELVRLFQTELEHYEKIEGTTLSMDGKANRLSALIRGNLGMAMQGLAVVPLFAGFDLVGEHGRIFSYDVTGGRYEETAFHSVGLGLGVRQGVAEEALPRGLRRDPVRHGRRAGAVRRRRRRLRHRWPRHGPPDLPGRQRDHARRPRPTLPGAGRGDRRRGRRRPAATTRRPRSASHSERASNPTEPCLACSWGGGRHEHAVLRLARADDEGPGRLRAQGHRAGTFGRGDPLRRRRAVRLREPLRGAAQDQRDLRPDRLRRGRSLQRVREPPDRRRAPRRHARLLLRPARRDRSRPGQRLCPDPGHDLLLGRREALRDRDLRRGGRGHARGRPGLPAHLRRPGRRGARRRRDGWRGRVRHEVPRGALHPGAEPRRGPQAGRRGAGPQRDRPPRHPGA